MFARNGDDIILDLLISFPEAALGAEIEVPTLTGRARLKIDAGTQSGRILRMRDKGIPHLNSYGRGDQLVRVNVWVPTSLSAQDRRRPQAARRLGEHASEGRRQIGPLGKEFLRENEESVLLS